MGSWSRSEGGSFWQERGEELLSNLHKTVAIVLVSSSLLVTVIA